jgi:hypothetical protein
MSNSTGPRQQVSGSMNSSPLQQLLEGAAVSDGKGHVSECGVEKIAVAAAGAPEWPGHPWTIADQRTLSNVIRLLQITSVTF